MKNLTRLLTVAAMAAIMAVPSMASAAARTDGSNCDYTQDEANSTDLGAAGVDLVVYGGGSDGVSGEALVVAGACLDTNGQVAEGGNRLDGGTLEAGAGIPAGGPGAYAVADGDNDNVDPSASNLSQGYLGVSTFETDPGAVDTCDGSNNDTGGGSNGGGCLTIYSAMTGPVAAVPLVPLVCGNTTGNQWEASSRDGCTIPE